MKTGTIWRNITRTAELALRTGALLPVLTQHTFIEEAGVRYFVRVLEKLKRKDEARAAQSREVRTGHASPFLPPERDLTVGEISESHWAVLNKFNVLNNHILIVTKEYEDQTTLLTLRDFEALWACMSEYESIGFYNGGREAGASQRHKHLQVVPLPLAPEGPAIPLEPLLETASSRDLSGIPALPFFHLFSPITFIKEPRIMALRSMDLYIAMLKRLGMRTPHDLQPVHQSMPYSLLVTRRWILLVPRSREFYGTISLNSLAFAGSFFVRDVSQLEELKRAGIMTALKYVVMTPKMP